MSALPLLIILLGVLFIGLYITRDKRTPEQKRIDEIDSLSVPDEIKDILKMSDEERKEKSRREAQEWMDSILKCRISSALAKRQLYKSLYHLSDEDVENAMQNYFRRSGITNEDMIRLGFEATLH